MREAPGRRRGAALGNRGDPARLALALALAIALPPGAGCSFQLPREGARAVVTWRSFEEAKRADGRIEAGVTDSFQLSELGFDPAVQANARNLSYLELLLDLLAFQRKKRTTGWDFGALIVVVDHTAVYQTWSGTTELETDEEEIRPSGPLPEPFEILRALLL